MTPTSIPDQIAQTQIDSLNRSDDPRDKSHATLLTMALSISHKMDGQDVKMDAQSVEIKTIRDEQRAVAKTHSGRLDKHEVNFEEIGNIFRAQIEVHNSRLVALEEPAKRLRWTWQFVTKLCAIITVIFGLVFGLMSSPAWPKSESQEDAIKRAVAEALKDATPVK